MDNQHTKQSRNTLIKKHANNDIFNYVFIYVDE